MFLFCWLFIEEIVVKILDVELLEVVICLEGMRNSKVIFVIEEKEFFYDIYFLM